MSKQLKTIEEIKDELDTLGYESRLIKDSLFLKIGTSNASFVANLNIENTDLVIRCQVVNLNQVEINQDFCLGLLYQNTIVMPYAFALLVDTETEAASIVLADSVSILSFTSDELESAISDLRKALLASVAILKNGLNNNNSFEVNNDVDIDYEIEEEVEEPSGIFSYWGTHPLNPSNIAGFFGFGAGSLVLENHHEKNEMDAEESKNPTNHATGTYLDSSSNNYTSPSRSCDISGSRDYSSVCNDRGSHSSDASSSSSESCYSGGSDSSDSSD